MTTTDLADIATTVERARAAYDAGATRPLGWRVAVLQRLKAVLAQHESGILDALAADFGKPRTEAWVTEIGFTLAEIDHTLAHLAQWMKPDRVATPVTLQPGSSHIVPEPKGVVCVIAPWNYPVQLTLAPAVAAIAAGNAVVLKPSELTPHTDEVLGRIVADLGDPAVQVVHGAVDETTELLAQRFDHILYTGNGRVARIVAKAAAEHLTPTTLELGGKSPAIVSATADIGVAAKRIAWGKFVNAGQTCIAPDYVLVERQVHDELVAALGDAIGEFYGPDPQASPDLARIVDDAHFERLSRLLDSGTVVVGGQTDAATRFIAPTVLTGVNRDDEVMQDEIFGPILPVIAVDSLADAVAFVNADEKPLALYSFASDDAEHDLVLGGATSGGACINGTLFHISNPHLPFGGVGESGHGAYHGKHGFDTFSHRRAVHQRSTRVDPPLLYPPYTARKSKILRRGFVLPDPRDLLARLRTAITSRLTR